MAAPDYVFTRDFLDNNRINLQHYLWIELFGYHIHPTIPTNHRNLRIADIGTGTGIWLTDLARRLPSTVSLDGLDISFGATPPPKTLPSNVTLQLYDVFSETPDHLRGVYDIVHIRNFSFVLKDNEAERVTRNILELLKPGGYIQWAEPDVSSFRIEKTHPECKVTALTELIKVSQGQDARFHSTWVPRLPMIFEQLGLEEVQSDVKEAPPYMGVAKHECNLLIHELVARKSHNAVVAQELKRIMPEVTEETQQGAYWAFTRWTIVGRKAGIA
ncbi:hypothetical protein BO94DRAFT_623364 [Aspergillus sclerotioniger CBS 115572]|uniref:S-adenosyl-L-methionine-dependent methyltransferase n=1 Tax=Aspergillus sclerotioniger CBS 115572 TaxID=1450535 RepID=A0A317WXK3_9EURO|nr:hypothetical protein BO94DRAFT_623364 [Aspergillus sclerotioniger CBS 115572]PWY90621.1 hypothetical protein BO94DRAFT_623364 [Aspergillus sclerotioniger CBS 115572]